MSNQPAEAGPGGDGEPATRLTRRLGTPDAVVIGMGSMIGAGVFVAIAPAAAAAGEGLLIGLAIAALVAYANATSSARLAVLYPVSGGTYVYGRERLGHGWGFLAGWAFVVGKTASCAAMALTLGAYVAPDLARPLAVAAVVGLSAVNLAGITKTAWLTRVILTVVLATLAAVVTASVSAGSGSLDTWSLGGGGVAGVLEAAALWFFAFAGYARIATLGEEVRDPGRTIGRAIPLALGLTLVVYAAVAVTAVVAVGADRLAESSAPLATAVEAGSLDALVPLVRLGAAVASAGVLLSLLAGVGRTSFAMAAEGDLPGWLGAVHPTSRVPHRAQVVIAALVVAVVIVADVRGAIGFSSFGVLTYYGLANASALTLGPAERRWPRWLAAGGVVGCAVLALSLPLTSVVGGLILLGSGVVVWMLRRRRE